MDEADLAQRTEEAMAKVNRYGVMQIAVMTGRQKTNSKHGHKHGAADRRG